MNNTKTNRTPVTVCYPGFLGVSVVDAYLTDHGLVPYAQYASAVAVAFVPKGKRNVRGATFTYKPEVVIIAGHRAAELEAPKFATVSENADVRVERALYSACDPRWASDFNARLAALPNVEIVADYRGHDPHAPIGPSDRRFGACGLQTPMAGA